MKNKVTHDIRIRNCPEELRRSLKSNAALEGMSISDYVIKSLSEIHKIKKG